MADRVVILVATEGGRRDILADSDALQQECSFVSYLEDEDKNFAKSQ